MSSVIQTYHRPDGVVGCGFFGEFGGLWQHSIAWPDQAAARLRTEDLEDRKIEVKPIESAAKPKVDTAPKPTPDPVTTTAEPPADESTEFDLTASEAANIRIAIGAYPEMSNKEIIGILNTSGIDVSSSQVTRERKSLKAIADNAVETE